MIRTKNEPTGLQWFVYFRFVIYASLYDFGLKARLEKLNFHIWYNFEFSV